MSWLLSSGRRDENKHGQDIQTKDVYALGSKRVCRLGLDFLRDGMPRGMHVHHWRQKKSKKISDAK